MALPALTAYAPFSTGNPIFGGRWPGGKLSGAAELGEIEETGTLGVRLSVMGGLAQLGDIAPSGTVTGVVTWGTGSEVGALSDNQWTPGRNGSGEVTQASVSTLPLNTWVRVNGSQLSTLTAAITALTGYPFSRYDLSQDGIAATFQAWVGACTDGTDVYFPRGGGHADNSSNGIWRWSSVKMRWEVVRAPSDPYDPVYPWSNRYAIQGTPETGTYTAYIDAAGATTDLDGIVQDKLPDGTPTSAHTYNGVWFDKARNQLGTSRVSKWVYDLSTNQWARSRWTIQGVTQPATIYHDLHYHAATDRVYGPLGKNDSDYFQFRRFGATSAVVEDIAGPPGWAVRGSNGVRLDEDRVWWSWQNSGERAAIFNMATGTWTSLGLVTAGKTLAGYASMSAGVFVPTWGAAGQIIRRGSSDSLPNQWWLYDMATNTNLDYVPAGRPPPNGTVYPGNKYIRLDRLGILFAVNEDRASTASGLPAVHVLRYA